MPETYTYWVSTALLSLLYLFSAALYVLRPGFVRQVLGELGYPAAYLVPFMAMIKVLAVAAILSRVGVGLSDLAYAGILFHLLLSGLAHIGADKPSGAAPALIGLLLLAASFTTQNSARERPSPYAAASHAIPLNERN
jgi:small-conductance mechanosensitive channel